MFKMMPECVMIVSTDGRLLEMNPAGLRMIGVKDGPRMVGRPVLGLIHPGDRSAFGDMHRRVCAGEEQKLEFRLLDSKGDVRWGRSDCTPLRCSDDSVQAVLAVVHDITEKRHAPDSACKHPTLLEHAQHIGGMGSWVLELVSGRLEWSEATRELFGVAPEDFGETAEDYLALVLDEDRGSLETAHANAAVGDEPYLTEFRIRRPDGEVRWMSERGHVERGSGGEPLRRVGMVMDVTERKRAEMRSHRGSSVLTAISMGVPLHAVLPQCARGIEEVMPGAQSAILLVDPEATCLRLEAAPSLPESFRRRLDGLVVSPRTPLGAAVLRREAVIVPDLHSGDEWVEHREAAREHGLRSCWATPVMDVAGRPLAVVAVWSDAVWNPSPKQVEALARSTPFVRLAIDRHVREREMQVGEERHSETFRHASSGIAVTDTRGRFVQANPAFCRMVEFVEDDLLNLDIRTLAHPDDRDLDAPLLGELLEGRRESFVVERRYLRRSGGVVWSRTSVSAMRDAEGRPTAIIRISEDITDHRLVTKRLQQSEALLQIASRIAKIGAWSIEVPSLELHWSAAAREIHEIDAGEIPTAAELVDYYVPEHRNRIRSAFFGCLGDGVPFDEELRLCTARGREAWVRTIGEAVRDASGTIIRVQGAIQDIHERKEVERLLATTLESIADAFFTLDRDWRFTYVNAHAERMMGRRRGDLLGRNIWEEFEGSADTIFYREYHRAVTENVSVIAEDTFPVGGTVFEARAHPFPEGLAVYLHDITERRRVEGKIREQAALLDRARDGIIVRDLAHRIVYWNQGAERMYGWTAGEAIGRSAEELLYRNVDPFRAAMDAVLAKGEWTGEFEHFTKNGEKRCVEGRWTLVRDDAGSPTSILAINTDITQRKSLETQFLRAQRLESVGTLAGGIAHDLNNMLAPILMSISILREDETDPERLSDLATIESCGRRGAEMVGQLLSFARGASGGPRVAVDMANIATEMTKRIGDSFPANVRVRLEIAADLRQIRVDPTQMHQVLTNLCVNARDAMPSGGDLTIGIEMVNVDEAYAAMVVGAKLGPHLRMRVEDSGLGMTAAVQERMFEPFFTTKEAGEGTGLGLSAVHAVVRSHEGFTRVYSEVGAGTAVHVYLPAGAIEADAGERVVPRSDLPRGQGELVLLVDDEESIRTMARRTLERFGYRVLTACNGVEAISVYSGSPEKVAVVLTDMAMPEMDGPATILALKGLDADVRIIGSSGFGASASVTKATEAGVRHFVPKPYTAIELLSVLRKILAE